MFLDIILWPFLMFFRGLKLIFKPFSLKKENTKNIKKEVSKETVKVKNKKQEVLTESREVKTKRLVTDEKIDLNNNDTKNSNKKLRFTYKIRLENGKIVSDYFDANNEQNVKIFLESQGYDVVSIKEDKLSNMLGLTKVESTKRMRYKDLTFFLTQLSAFVRSGVTLVDALSILSSQVKKRNLKLVYRKLIFEINTGVSFSDALAHQGDVFPKLLINMIRTSELTGNLTEVLDDMTEYYKRSDSNRKQIISAMTYPSIVFIFSIGVLTFIILYVVPQFTSMYEQNGSNLPWITSFIINVSDFTKNNILIIFLSIILVIGLVITLYKNISAFRYGIQWILLHIPVIKNVIIYNEVVMFTSTFASLVKHDVFITDSMEILGKISSNEIYKIMIRDAVVNLSNGDGISLAFKGHWAFPQTAYEMLLTGERTGKLGMMMESVSQFYQEQQKTLVTQLKSLIEPIMIVVLAFMVGIVLLAVIVPMFSMYEQMI